MSDSRAALLAEAQDNLRNGRLPQAEQLCLRVMQMNNNDVGALEMLAAIALQHGAADRAESYLMRCTKLEPREAKHVFNLGKIRSTMGRLKEALKLYDRALELYPTYAIAIAAKADVLNQLGERAQARAMLEPFVRFTADTPAMALTFATILHQSGEHAEAVRVLERHARDSLMDQITATRIGLLLGQAYERMGDVDKAFDAYQRGNALRARASQFNLDRYMFSVNRLTDFFSTERMKTLARSTLTTRSPVFIVGMPRSGMALIEQIIAAHPQARGAGEVVELERLASGLPERIGSSRPFPDCIADMTTQHADDLGKAYLREASKAAGQATRIVDRYSRNHHLLGLVQLIFPNAHVIYCRRDPLDACLSCYSSALSPIMNGFACDLRALGAYYRQHERLMEHWRSVLDLQILDVQYEELVADPEPNMRRVIEFLGLPWDEQCLQYHQADRASPAMSYDQVRQPIYGHAVGRARPFEKHLGPLRAALAGTP